MVGVCFRTMTDVAARHVADHVAVLTQKAQETEEGLKLTWV